MTATYIFIIVFALIVAALLYARHRRTQNAAESSLNWTATLFNDERDPTCVAMDTFSSYEHEENELIAASGEEREDIFASYAMFFAYLNINKLTETSQIVLNHPKYAPIRFMPDYDNGHLVGVKDDTRVANAKRVDAASSVR